MVAEKSKAPLNLMEQVVMILVFAFAAALCVQAFVVTDGMSKEAYARDKAAVISQMVAETVKSQNGDKEQSALLLEGTVTETGILVGYTEAWETCSEEAATYCAELMIKESDAYLSKGEVTVRETKTQKVIFSLPVSWQNLQR